MTPLVNPSVWQYRWLNPGNYKNIPPSDLEWKEVVPNRMQTIGDRLDELQSFKSAGNPCYEVRPLYALNTDQLTDAQLLECLRQSCAELRQEPPVRLPPGLRAFGYAVEAMTRNQLITP